MNSLQKQFALFDLPVTEAVSHGIKGLSYIPNFVDAKTESLLLQRIDAQPWMNDLKRRVQHYGYRYDYRARAVTRESYLGPLPEWLLSYCERLCREGLFLQRPDQVIVNEYQPGQGISPHVDCVPCFGDAIASLSFGSPCVMEFTHSVTEQKATILLERRSLVVLSAEARYSWKHGISGRKADCFQGLTFQRDRRVSLTFREVIAA